MMARTTVSVVTPFYNTADYLHECIESVLAQTRGDFEYILVDNQSTDGSAEIAHQYASSDARIKLIRTPQFFTQVQNYNFALSQISPVTQYCKVVQADDRIFPECLERMMAIADSHPSIGYVAAYFLEGDHVKGGPVPAQMNVLDGRSVCRASFTSPVGVFGSPTTLLYRACLVREQQPFYDERYLHEDTDALFRILKTWDVGFVHQVLSFTRTDNVSITSAVRDCNPYRLDQFLRALLYTHEFFAPDEADECLKRAEVEYLRFLATKVIERKNAKFWNYHKKGLATAAYTWSKLHLAAYVGLEFMDLVGNPKSTLSALFRRHIHAVPPPRALRTAILADDMRSTRCHTASE